MELVKTIKEIQEKLADRRISQAIGFVPTMGALHEGHLSLIRQASSENEVVVASIFVNPTQFNDKNDLKKYPRTLDSDLEKLSQTKCDYVFYPEVNEMYPEPDTRKFNFGLLETVMEGKHRPGHFNGVAQVVSKLFDIVQPTRAYFGLKDFQQLAIIKALVKQLDLDVQIVACPIIREPDGLAMSSRNMRLTPEQRLNSAIISKTLFDANNLIPNFDVQKVREWVISTINKNPYLSVEYFEIVDDEMLQPITSWDEQNNKVGCIAVHCGEVRLIDNVIFN